MSDLKIKFSVHENPLKDEKGRTTYQVRQDTMGVATTETLERLLAYHNAQNSFTLDGAVHVIQQLLVQQLNFNRQLHLKGLGTFSLTIGLKPVVDEDGKKHNRVVTDPKEITGNDLEVTGISFKPDKELMEKAQSELVYFEHSAPRGSVGHSDEYTEEELKASLTQWFAENDYLTRSLFRKVWHVTEYRAKEWLQQLTSGEHPFLRVRKQASTFFYYLNTAGV